MYSNLEITVAMNGSDVCINTHFDTNWQSYKEQYAVLTRKQNEEKRMAKKQLLASEPKTNGDN